MRRSQSHVIGDIALAATLADFVALIWRMSAPEPIPIFTAMRYTNSPRSLSTSLVMKLATICTRRRGRTDS